MGSIGLRRIIVMEDEMGKKMDNGVDVIQVLIRATVNIRLIQGPSRVDTGVLTVVSSST